MTKEERRKIHEEMRMVRSLFEQRLADGASKNELHALFIRHSELFSHVMRSFDGGDKFANTMDGLVSAVNGMSETVSGRSKTEDSIQ